MRFTKEYYILKYDEFESMIEYLTHIKLFEERIIVTKVVFMFDKQTILCLAISLPDDLQYLIKIWDVMIDMIVEKARVILLKEERKRGKRDSEGRYAFAFFGGKKTGVENKPKCRICGKFHKSVC